MSREHALDQEKEEERQPLDLIAEEYCQRVRRGESPRVEEYIEKNPELAEEIRQLIAALELVEGFSTDVDVDAGTLGAGQRIGDYRIVREIGRGGMGIVYEAVQPSLGRRVALKVFSAQAGVDRRFLKRFQREARAAAALQHGGIVPIFGVGSESDLHYYAMRFVEGRGLDECLMDPSEELDPRRVARIGRQMAEALSCAHSHGILHRDIKPSNVLLDTEGRAWITDFGLCKVEGAEDLSAAGHVVGTLRYMAPERFSGHCDERSDIYGVGITLYELLTRSRPFGEVEPPELVRRVTDSGLPRIRRLDPRLPRDLETIISRALERDPQQRYESAEQLSRDLQAFIEGRPIAARPPTFTYLFWLAIRRQKLLSATIAASVLLVAVLSAIYVTSLREALEERDTSLRRARAFALAGAASEMVQIDPLLGLLLAREAVHLESTPATLSRLHRALGGVHERVVLKGHGESLSAAGFSGDGTLIVTTTLKRARFWDQHGRLTVELPEPDAPIVSARIAPTGDRVAMGLADGTVQIWSRTGSPVLQIAASRSPIWDVCFATDGKRVAVASRDGAGQIFDESGAKVAELTGHTDALTSIEVYKDDQWVTASRDGSARVWTAAGQPVAVFERPDDPLLAARPSPVGERILVHGLDQVTLWTPANGQRVPLIGHDDRPNAATFSPDGRTILTVSADQTARLWNLEGQVLAVLRGHGGAVSDGEFSPDGQQVATASYDQTVRLWDLRGNLLEVLRGHESSVRAVSYSPDGRTLLTASDDHTARLWEPLSREAPVIRGHKRGLYQAVYTPDGRILTASQDETAQLWSGEGQPLQTFEGHQSWVFSAETSPDGQQVFTTALDATARVWSIDGTCTRVIHPENGRALGAHLDRGWYLARSRERDLVLLTLEGETLAQFHGHESRVWTATIDRDATSVLTASSDRTARLWSIDGKEQQVFRGHESGVRTAVFSPDGRLVLTASDDGTARLWDRDGTLRVTLRGHEGAILDARFSPDGQTVATASRDKTARLWSLDGQLITVLSGHQGVVWSAHFSADGRRLVTSSSDRTARVWIVHADELLRLADARAFRDFTPEERERFGDLLATD